MANCFQRPSTTVPAALMSEDEILQPANLRSFTFKDLNKAMRNFRPDSVLRGSGFGSILKGWANEASFARASSGTGMPIAIKKLNQENFQIHKEWLDETSHLGRSSHPNLVKLLGYCLEDEQHILVWASHLQPLSWDLRVKVALGAAKGVTFLHSDKANVICGDFKTSDILLDSDPTAESDVYSFRVVLLEILAGQRRLDRNRPSGEQDLVEWARTHLRPQKAASLALKCLSSDVSACTGMEQVVTTLEQLQGSKETTVSDQEMGSGGGSCGFVGKFGRSRQRQP
ncbi:hypothetical protein VPH35_126356 [Triticum aestivum]